MKWSPYRGDIIALATSQHFALKGNGKQEILKVDHNGVTMINSFYTKDSIYDCAWCEENEFYLVSACGDGSIKLWDINKDQYPIRSWQEHTEEVESVDWNYHVSQLKFRSAYV